MIKNYGKSFVNILQNRTMSQVPVSRLNTGDTFEIVQS